MQRKMKLLIMSAGSLVGQNILDSLEQKRREIDVIGMNSEAANPRLVRCDRAYLVAPLHEAIRFEDDFVNIVEKEKPDMILAGRDHDVPFLSEIQERKPAFKKIIPYGDARLAVMMQDKFLSYQYAEKSNLPFADSCLYASPSDVPDLKSFLDRHPFPLLSKPRRGFGSLGVCYVMNREQLDRLLADAKDDILFQEYLGTVPDFERWARPLQYGIPLFFQIPETNQFAAQTTLSRNGDIAEIFISINTMAAGRAEYSKRIELPEIENIVLRYARTLCRDGWYGPLNIQLKQDRRNQWKVFELNPRMTGTTSARYRMGYDEIGILTDYFLPEMKLSNHTKAIKPQGEVFKYLTDNYLSDADTDHLKKTKAWEKF